MLLTCLQVSIEKIFLGEEGWSFMAEVAVRSFIMYFILFITLKVTGKRGIKQLSVFELIIILGLGSASGDPMLYKEVGIVHVVLIFIIIVALYRLTTFALSWSPKMEEILEGRAIYVIENGEYCIDTINKKFLGEDEFLAELRKEKITQLAQVKVAILETDGELSVFYEEDEKVGYGLPILPKEFHQQIEHIGKVGFYSCSFCGNTKQLQPVQKIVCKKCGKHRWVLSTNEKRIT